MFGLSFEHILIFGVVLLIFGPRRLPELGMSLGKAIKNFKDSYSGIQEAQAKKIEESKASGAVEPKNPASGGDVPPTV